MSFQDPIADMFTRIRNAQAAKKPDVVLPSSKQKIAIARALQEEGYINEYAVEPIENNKTNLIIRLKYHQTKPVIQNIRRISKPSLRVYKNRKQLPNYMGGLGVVLVTTDKGIMSDKQARKLGLGGEIICYVS